MKKILLFCLVLLSSTAFSQVDVTFKVDMRGYNLPFTTANVNGTFNGWCGACNPMTDANNDSIWELTIPLPTSTTPIEFKFTVDGWVGQEMLTPGSPCTATNSGFTNRVLVLSAPTVLPVNCWGKCGECGPLGPQKLQIRLPITWQDSAATNLTTTDFGGTFSQIASDPAIAGRLALKITKTGAAETWAGTTLGTSAGFPANIPFAANSNQMQLQIYSANVGSTIKLKAENKADPTQSVETDAVTTTSGAWEILTFNFANQSTGTSAINYSYPYNKLSVFPNFGVTGAAAGEKVYYLGQVAFGTVTSNQGLVFSKEIVISPNPGSGIFTLTSSEIEGQNVQISVLDVLGKTVYSSTKRNAGKDVKMDLSDLNKGLYFVQISANGKVATQRLVVAN